MDVEVVGFEWDWDEDGNVDHIGRHAVSPEDVGEVKDNKPRFGQNPAYKSATHIMVGPNLAGRYLHVAMIPTFRHGYWFVVTANWLTARRGERLYRNLA